LAEIDACDGVLTASTSKQFYDEEQATMSRTTQTLATAIAAVLLLPGFAFAHPGHDHAGAAAGFMHPLSGVDHILAMLAVGIWAAQLGGRAIWALPAAFLGAMIVGGAVGMSGGQVGMTEQGILASVFVLGLMVTIAAKLPVSVGVTIVGLFAFCHGYAHGHELPAGGSGLPFSFGFAAATASLHAIGLGMALLVGRKAEPAFVRAFGVVILLGGVVLALDMF
jgi:urease accessory protein